MVMQFDVRNAVNQCQVKMRQIMIGLYLYFSQIWLSQLCDAVVFTILRHLSLSSAALTASCIVIPVL